MRFGIWNLRFGIWDLAIEKFNTLRLIMLRRIYILVLLVCISAFVNAQISHTAKLHYVKAANKQIMMAGYEIGSHKISYHICGGIGDGTDNKFLSAENSTNQAAIRKVKDSQTVFPDPKPSDTYLESCQTNYKIQQLRIGFTVYVRRNDTLSRHPFTGPHFGVEAMFSSIRETQTVTYKSHSDETRYIFSGTNNFPAIGAGTHVGWQFAFFKEHLYIDLRAVIPFYFPFTSEPNLNSPFAGNKWEAQVSVGWRFHRDDHADKAEDGEKGKVRRTL